MFSIVRIAGICQGYVLAQFYGLGSETRQTLTHVPDPYAIEVGNPAAIPGGYEWWLLIVHAIDSRGVVDRMGCTCKVIVTFLEMDGQTSWVMYIAGSDVTEITSFSEINNEGDKISMVSLDFILPDVLLESVLGYLPIVSIVRAGSVCKRWKEAVKSRGFLWISSFLVQKPWYFMFTGGVDPGVCFMDGFSRRLIYFPDYSALAVSVDRKLHGYTIAVATSKQRQSPGQLLSQKCFQDGEEVTRV
ncbi:hypothetical protein ACLOJK_019842 [Asimina triloba]